MSLLGSSIHTGTSSLLVIPGADDARHAPDYALASDVALIVTEHGDGCIVDLNGSFYAVSSVAAAMLRDAVEHGRDGAIVRNAARYGIEESRIAADLDDLLDDMVRRGLLQSRHSRRPDGARRILAGALAGAAAFALRVAGTQRSRAWFALGLARLSFALSGWNATVTAWRQRFGPQRQAPAQSRADEFTQAIDEAVRRSAARHMMNVDCKERALASFALARRAGLPATLIVGVEFYPLAGHSWCESGDTVIGDERSHCRRFTPAFRFS